MILQPSQQTITTHILPNISWNKNNKTMKLSQLMEYVKRNIFLQNYAEKKAGRLVFF